MSVLHINPGRSCETATVPDDRDARWCFQCRKRLAHTWHMIEDPPERQPSYYDPRPVLRCSGCGEDHAAFPGMYIDGPHYPESREVWAALCAKATLTRKSWDWDAIWARDREQREALS